MQVIPAAAEQLESLDLLVQMDDLDDREIKVNLAPRVY